MNSCVAVVFFAALAAANAGWVSPLALSAIPTGHVIQGPSARSTVVGPDGSSISSAAPGGTIIADNNGGAIVAQGAPAAVISPAARLAVAPIVAAQAPLLAAPAITSYVAPAPVWAPQTVVSPLLGNIAAENTVVAGPSGTIVQTKAINAANPAVLW